MSARTRAGIGTPPEGLLVVAPHADDEILGAGGVMARAAAAGRPVYVCVVTRGVTPLFDEGFLERLREEARACHRLLGVARTWFLDFPSVRLETVPRETLNERLREVVEAARPADVYIPHRGDMQLDHRLTAEAAMVALRPPCARSVRRILAYETPSETGWNIPGGGNDFTPAVYEDIEGYLPVKLEALRCYQSQLQPFPHPRSEEAAEALARYRGSAVCLRAAEAFMLIREIRSR